MVLHFHMGIWIETRRHYFSTSIPVEVKYPSPRSLINSHLFGFQKLMKWTCLGEPVSYKVLSLDYSLAYFICYGGCFNEFYCTF